jgi:hypothetical protein
MMVAVRTSETSVDFNGTTRRYIPDDSKLQTKHLFAIESAKFHSIYGNGIGLLFEDNVKPS